ncbi:DUF342 domain-containing protein [Geobacter argillaceus]|uniref:Flagellar Assembly Protein A N-terminal region domain-containing protein n=1 Tax=Geobacter argillaceus TaxID=345631 RepID=A0A562WSM6_9BACT|nr:FapA family protein [Geobacter argillaceus]TWJ33390.1 hypothetical protein JN12_00062 [Geobacter argillaceus]
MSFMTFQLQGAKLLAICRPSDLTAPLNDVAFRQALANEGYAAYALQPAAVAELIRRCNGEQAEFSLEVGERRDGACAITLTGDKMSALLSITPPQGGAAVTREQVLQKLHECGVVTGILEHEIMQAVVTGNCSGTVVACGRQPVRGADIQFVSLVQEVKERQPHLEDDGGVVDYRDMGDIISVTVGTPLMRRVPATPGEPGENVCGEGIPATPGNDLPFSSTLQGTVQSADDPDLLVAAIAGQPVLLANGVMVEPTISFKTVDLSTGNVRFEGSITIDADVREGMVVHASGDIVVGGVVEGAILEAGGNIEVKGGVIGQGEVRTSKGEIAPEAARIHAGGSASVNFVENAVITAGEDITVNDFAMQSELTAGGQVVVGNAESRHGHIIGGACRAAVLVQAVTLGSPAGVGTRIEVGVDPFVNEKLTAVLASMEAKEREVQEFEKYLNYLREHPEKGTPELIRLKERAYHGKQTELIELVGQKKRLQKRLEPIPTARIEVARNVYAAVKMTISNHNHIVEEDLAGGVKFRWSEEEQSVVY